ncbi:uncharacterized protein [Danio rerio]|uniref:Uncharacterized protein n=1 Tax=Danio rerio TaxID=7955 RepID=A0AC58GMP3_DANRE
MRVDAPGFVFCCCSWTYIFNQHISSNCSSRSISHISCRYKPSDETVAFDVKLENNYSNYILCSIIDTGTYKCVQTRTIPPPSVVLREDRTFVQVIARPTVSVSQTRGLNGFTILCSSEEFYPSAIEQVWMRNGEFQNISQTLNINKTNPDGSFTLHSYLNTSDCENYSCWVNHSTLSQPTTLHVLPNYCNKDRGVWLAVKTSALLIIVIILIIAVFCAHYRSRNLQSQNVQNYTNQVVMFIRAYHRFSCPI